MISNWNEGESEGEGEGESEGDGESESEGDGEALGSRPTLVLP